MPDFPTKLTIKLRQTIVEVKNVKKLSDSAQIRDLIEFAQSNNVVLEIFTNAKAPSSGGLADAIEAGFVILSPIP